MKIYKVPKEVYEVVIKRFAGSLFHRKDDTGYYVKPLKHLDAVIARVGTLTALLMLTVMAAMGQKTKIDFRIDTIMPDTGESVYQLPTGAHHYTYAIIKNGSALATCDTTGKWNIKDASAALTTVCKTTFQEGERLSEQIRLADDVLREIKLNGKISNWKRFHKAAFKYYAYTTRRFPSN